MSYDSATHESTHFVFKQHTARLRHNQVKRHNDESYEKNDVIDQASLKNESFVVSPDLLYFTDFSILTSRTWGLNSSFDQGNSL